MQAGRRNWWNRSLLGLGLVVWTSSFSSSQAQTAGSVLPAASGQKAVSKNIENAQPASEMEQLAKTFSGIGRLRFIQNRMYPYPKAAKDGAKKFGDGVREDAL